MNANRIVLDKRWLEDAMVEFDTEDFNTICATIIRKGLFGEEERTGDGLIDTYIEDILVNCEKENAYKRTKVTSKEMKGEIWRLAQEGLTGKQIAERVGATEGTIFNNEGWQQRHNKDYLNYLESEKEEILKKKKKRMEKEKSADSEFKKSENVSN